MVVNYGGGNRYNSGSGPPMLMNLDMSHFQGLGAVKSA